MNIKKTVLTSFQFKPSLFANRRTSLSERVLSHFQHPLNWTCIFYSSLMKLFSPSPDKNNPNTQVCVYAHAHTQSYFIFLHLHQQSCIATVTQRESFNLLWQVNHPPAHHPTHWESQPSPHTREHIHAHSLSASKCDWDGVITTSGDRDSGLCAGELSGEDMF